MIFSMEWKWNGRKLPVEHGKIVFHSIPYHALLIMLNRRIIEWLEQHLKLVKLFIFLKTNVWCQCLVMLAQSGWTKTVPACDTGRESSFWWPIFRLWSEQYEKMVQWRVKKLLSCVVWRFGWATRIGYVWLQILVKHQPNGKADMWVKRYVTVVEKINWTNV